MQCELDAETRMELAALAYKAWTIAYDTLQKVKKEVDDNSPDWTKFHAIRLENAIAEKAKASRIFENIAKYSPIVKG